MYVGGWVWVCVCVCSNLKYVAVLILVGCRTVLHIIIKPAVIIAFRRYLKMFQLSYVYFLHRVNK